MAIKFSQFVVETDKANVNYLVGWDGAENVQITPADLLGSYPSGSGATGQVAFFDSASSIGGDNDLFFDNTNKRLGIGTTSPVTKLHIADVSTPTIRIEDTTNNKNIQLFHDNNNSFIRTSAGSQLKFQTDGNNDRMIITTSGNVGIGTTSPSAKLEVDGTLIATGISQLGSGGANVYLTSSSAGKVGIGTSSPSGRLEVNGDVKIGDTTTGAQLIKNGNDFDIVGVDVSGNAFNSLHLKADSLTGLYIEKDTNNIGIGITSPSSFNSRGRNLVVNSDGDTGITISANSTSSSTLLFADAFAGTGGTATYRGVVEYDHSNDSMAFSTSATEKMRVDSSGILLIDSTSTVFSDKLYVNSNAYTTGGWRVGTAGTYVGQLVNDSGKLALISDASRDISFKSITQGAIMFLEGSNGNVGIGTTSPGNLLHVYNTGNAEVKIERASGAQILLQAQSSAGVIGTQTNNDLDLKTNGSTRIKIENSGNVGIGATSPNYKFTAYGSSSDSEIVASFGSANDISEYTAIGLSGFIAGNDATKAGLALERTASFGVGKLHFLNNTTIDDSDMTLSDSRMVIDIDGNVGVGTTSPTATLHVESADDALLRLKSTDNKAYIALSDNDTNGYISSENSKLSLGANIGSNANNLNIDLTNNRVGIGTSSPASKLEVDGGDIEIDDSASGLILRSPDGTRYRVTVANGGTLSVSAV